MRLRSFVENHVMRKEELPYLWIIPQQETIYIFTSFNARSVLLAEDVREKEKESRILFLVREKKEIQGELKQRVLALNGMFVAIVKEQDFIGLLNRCKKNSLRFFAFGEEDNENLLVARKLAKWKKMESSEGSVCSLYLLLKKEEVFEFVEKNEFCGLELHLLNEGDLITRCFFQEVNLFSSIRVKGRLNVCLLGYNEITEALCKAIIYLGQSDGLALTIVLMDEKVKEASALFFQRNPEINKAAELILLDKKLNTAPCFEYFSKHIKKLDFLVSTDQNPVTIMEISRICLFNRAQVKLCAYQGEKRETQFLYETSLLKHVTVFGAMDTIYKESIIIMEELDELAKGCYNFNQTVDQDSRGWEGCSLFEKQGYRALALQIQSKLYTIGLQYVKNGDIKLLEAALKNEETEEALAKGEQMRWNAFYFSNGYRTMPQESTFYKMQEDSLKQHRFLVPWEELDALKEKYHEDFKERNRQVIRNLSKIISSVGYGISRIDKEK